jgi:hypothetical protein
MDLHSRMKCIVDVINKTDEELNSRQIASKYITMPTASDALTTGTILNVMSNLGLVIKKSYWAGKSARYTFRRKGNNLIVME